MRAAHSPTGSSRCGQRASCARSRDRPDARDAIDAAYEIATDTDAPLEHAVAALARAKVLAALGAEGAEDAGSDAALQLDALGLTCQGWLRIFDLALAGVSVPSS